MVKCAKGHVMVTENRKTWTEFKTFVCHTCIREAMLVAFK